MQKKGAVLLFAFFVSFAAMGIQPVKSQHAESGEGFSFASPITISSPSNSSYNSNELNLGICFRFLLSPNYAQVHYSINGKENCILDLRGTQNPIEAIRTYANETTTVVKSTFTVPFTIKGSAVLPPFKNDSYATTVYAPYISNNKIGLDKQIIYFTINNVSLNQNIEQITEFPEWTPLLLVVFIVIVMIIIYRYILNKLE